MHSLDHDQQELNSAVAEFIDAVETYTDEETLDYGPSTLWETAGRVINCNCDLPISPANADAVSKLTGESIEFETYSDAAYAIRRWQTTGAGASAIAASNQSVVDDLNLILDRALAESGGDRNKAAAQLTDIDPTVLDLLIGMLGAQRYEAFEVGHLARTLRDQQEQRNG